MNVYSAQFYKPVPVSDGEVRRQHGNCHVVAKNFETALALIRLRMRAEVKTISKLNYDPTCPVFVYSGGIEPLLTPEPR